MRVTRPAFSRSPVMTGFARCKNPEAPGLAGFVLGSKTAPENAVTQVPSRLIDASVMGHSHPVTAATSDLSTLLDALAAAPHAERLKLYEQTSARIDADDLRRQLVEGRPGAAWLALRVDAGPPDRELPACGTAVMRLFTDAATLADAAVLWLTPDGLQRDEAALLRHLERYLELAMQTGAGATFAVLVFQYSILSARSGCAATALERLVASPLGCAGEDWNHARAFLEPLAGDPVLRSSQWIRVAAALMWSRLDMPAADTCTPEIATLLPATMTTDPRPVLKHLRALDHELGPILDDFLGRVRDAHVREDMAAHPTIVAILRAAWTDAPRCDPTLEPPPELLVWARAMLRAGEVKAARLAAYLLYDTGRLTADELVPFVMLAMRRSDLAVLVEHGPREEFRELCRDYDESLHGLPDELADALVAICFRRDHASALAICFRHRVMLASAVDTMRPEMRAQVEALLRTMSAIADERGAAEPLWARLVARAQALAAELPRTAAALETQITAEAADPLPLALLELAGERISSLPPGVALRVALLLLTWLPGHEHAAIYQPAFAEAAVHAIVASEDAALYPKAAALVESLLEHGGVRHSVAELLYYRAKVAMPATLEDPARRTQALRDLERALALARRDGAGWCEVKASCLWVNLHLMELPAGLQRADALAQANAVLEAAESAAQQWEMLPELWSERARVRLLAGDPDGAAEAWRFALEHTPPRRHPAFRADLLANLAQTLLFSRRPDHLDDAEAAARAALRELPADSGPATTTFTRGILGLVLAHHPRPDRVAEAIVLLEEALRTPRQSHGLTNAPTLRLGLVLAYLRVHQLAEARHHLDVVATDPDVLMDPSLALDAVIRALELDEADDRDTARALLKRLLRLHADSVWRPTLELLQAIASDLRTAVGHARAYIAGELPRHPLVDEQLVRGIDRQIESLPHELLEQFLASDLLRPEHLHVRGKLLLALDKGKRLRAEFEQRLTEPQTEGERATTLAFLIAVLPARDPRRRRAIDELDTLLGKTGQRHLHAHLAAVLFEQCEDNPSDLRRAAEHAEAAGGDDPEVWRLRAEIRGAQMTALLAESSPRAVEIAAWFTQPIPLPARAVRQMRLAMVRQLLFPAALTHPAALDLAQSLVAQLTSEEADDLARRLAWIRRQREAPGGTGPVITGRTQGAETHFDGAPAWLVDLVAGRAANGARRLSREDARWLIDATHIRPDRASDLLIWFVEHAADLLPELVHDIAAVPVRGGRGSFAPRLRELLATLLGERPQFSLRKLEVMLLQSTLEWGDGTPYERSADALLELAKTPEQRAEAHYYKGIERLEAFQTGTAAAEAQLAAAREHLATAADLAAEHPLPSHLHFGILVSSGNAFRHGKHRDVERALAYYDRAETIGFASQYEEARLCKVRADALIVRGRGNDIDDALALLDRSLAIRRTGWLRSETLLSAHTAELARTDIALPERLRRALARLDEAAEYDDGALQQELIRLRVGLLDRLLDATPGDREALTRLDELAEAAPDIAHLIRFVHLRHQFPVGVRWDHPVMLDLAENTWGIIAPVRHRLEQKGERLQPPPVWAREQLRRLTPEAVGAARPGGVVARALLCAYLCGETGEVDTPTAQAAAEAAVQAVFAVTEPLVQAMLLGELSRVFAPDDHWSHPLRDFKRAAELCERALAIPGLPEALRTDLLGYLARATRYRNDGDVRGHLLHAEELYEQVVALRRRGGHLAEAEHTAANLAEVRAALQRGGTATARRTEIAALRQAVAVAGTGGLPIDRAGLARELTLLGSDTPGDEGTAMLAEGAEHFAALPWERMDPNLVESAENYRTICLAELAVRHGDGDGAVARWRTRLAKFDRTRQPKAWAMAAHNLADLLLRIGGPPGAREALELCTHALAIRSPDQDLEHHWETAFQLGQTVLALLDDRSQGRPTRAVYEFAVEAVRSALNVANALVGGERHFRTGITLLRLSLHALGSAQLGTLAELAWTHINRGRAALLADSRSAEIESAAALAVADALADRLGEQALVGITDGCEYVLTGDAAARVLPWLVRAAGGAHRRLAARTNRPSTVPHTTWMGWLTAIRSGDAGAIARELERVQAHAPEFLGGEPDLQGLTAWLKARAAAAAIIVLPGRHGYLAAVLEWRDGLRISVARLTAPPPPFGEADLARSIQAHEYGDLYRHVGHWADESVVAPLRRLVSDGLRHLVWICSGPLRMISPAHLWPHVAVSLAVDPCLRASPAALQPRVTVFVADPGPDGVPIPEPTRLAAHVAAAATRVGPLRVRLSSGARWGHQLGVEIPGLVDAPADASGLLCEVAESDIVLLMCHGSADGPDDAELKVITGDGRSERVTIQQIGADPRRIAGQLFILLSCETGRTGAWLHQAGGVAGALLACGARQVLAPLWPVFVEVAVDVGLAALTALSVRRELDEMLAELHATPVSAADRVSRDAFVLWVS